MKWYILAALFIFFTLIGLLFWKEILPHETKQEIIQTDSVPTPTTSPHIVQKVTTVSYKDKEYAYLLIGPIESSRISLHSNLPQKKQTQTLKEEFSCVELTSAGFYGVNNRHIGLFVVNDTIIEEQINNALFNGYFYSAKNGTVGIGQLLPDESLNFALQTGPFLVTENTPRVLRLKVDEEARRIAVGVTKEDTVVFFGVYKEDDTFSGPTLVDLPYVLKEIITKENLDISTVINLDGGNHSTIQTNTTNLLELSPAGGIFCIK